MFMVNKIFIYLAKSEFSADVWRSKNVETQSWVTKNSRSTGPQQQNTDDPLSLADRRCWRQATSAVGVQLLTNIYHTLPGAD